MHILYTTSRASVCIFSSAVLHLWIGHDMSQGSSPPSFPHSQSCNWFFTCGSFRRTPAASECRREPLELTLNRSQHKPGRANSWILWLTYSMYMFQWLGAIFCLDDRKWTKGRELQVCIADYLFLYLIPSSDVGLWLGLLIDSMSVMTPDYKH